MDARLLSHKNWYWDNVVNDINLEENDEIHSLIFNNLYKVVKTENTIKINKERWIVTPIRKQNAIYWKYIKTWYVIEI